MTIDLELLLKAYASGIFPMADSRDDPETFWVEPKRRAVIPLDGFKLSRSLRKTIRNDKFLVTTDTAFADVIALCAEAAADRKETWINSEIEEAFLALHRAGYAHSVECWLAEDAKPRLVGGLYGIAIGGAFCGESMFSRARDASKVALAWLIARLKIGGFGLLDCQFMTEHLASLGAIEISQEQYLEELHAVCNHNSPAFSLINSPIRSSGSSADVSPEGAVGLGAASGGASDGAGAGVAGVAGDVPVNGAATAGASAEEVTPSFGALDALLARLEDDDRGAVGSRISCGGSSSPGKLISHFLTQTS